MKKETVLTKKEKMLLSNINKIKDMIEQDGKYSKCKELIEFFLPYLMKRNSEVKITIEVGKKHDDDVLVCYMTNTIYEPIIHILFNDEIPIIRIRNYENDFNIYLNSVESVIIDSCRNFRQVRININKIDYFITIID